MRWAIGKAPRGSRFAVDKPLQGWYRDAGFEKKLKASGDVGDRIAAKGFPKWDLVCCPGQSVIVSRDSRAVVLNPKDLTWFVMEAGKYAAEESGMDAEAVVMKSVPRKTSRDLMGRPISCADRKSMLRATLLGQVLTTHDEKWSEFYYIQDRDNLACQVGCHHGMDASPRLAEEIGFILLQKGGCQIDGRPLVVGSDVRWGDPVLTPVDVSGKSLLRSFKKEL